MTYFKMKKYLLLLLLSVFSFNLLFAQNNSEKEIRRLELIEKEAMLKGDTMALYKIWHPKYVVNNPYGVVVTIPQISYLIKTGKIDYSSFDREIEKITFIDNVCIVMGKETTTPQNATENAGNIVVRRYTHTWMKNKNVWSLVARQASIFN
jgi:hypothetical protein